MIRTDGISGRAISEERKTASSRQLRITSIALGSALLSLVNMSSALCADTASGKPDTANGANKQIAAIESLKAKDAAVTPANALPALAPPGQAALDLSTPLAPDATAGGAADANVPKLLLKKGQTLEVPLETEDVQPTDDVNLAKEQALHFPDNAEASFILAVALTRTSRVEEALQEVRRARKLAQLQGGPAYFDKMIKSYEDMLQDTEDPRVRYSLAWAYYMKAYLLAQDSRRAMTNPAALPSMTAPPVVPPTTDTATPSIPTAATAPSGAAPAIPANTAVPNTVSAKAEKKKVDPTMALMLLNGLNPGIAAKMSQPESGKIPSAQLPMIPTAIQKAAPSAVPQVHQYYAQALKNLDAVLAKKPDDVWALLYRWHLYAEDTGNLNEAMKQWKEAEHRFPSNPGVQLFLAEGYVKEGNLKEAIMHASKAVFLRGTGN